MTAVPPPPPPIKSEPVELHPIQMFNDPKNGIRDFGPRVLPADAEVEPSPKGAAARSWNSEVTQPTEPSSELPTNQETLPLEPAESETEQILSSQSVPPAPGAAIPSPSNFLPTGSSPTSTGSQPASVPGPSIR